jgi:mono/diheme cytochrome c family protein
MSVLKSSVLIVAGMTATLAFAALAKAQSRAESEIAAGRELAASACSPCHALAAPSPPQSSAAASFAEIAQGAKSSGAALHDFLRSTHNNVSHPGAMPNPQLTEKQIDAIAAYVASLRRTK